MAAAASSSMVAIAPSQHAPPPVWQDASTAKACCSCRQPFGFMSTKRHCRRCGSLACDACTGTRIALPPLHVEPVPVCRTCWTAVLSGMAAQAASTPQFSENLQTLHAVFPRLDAEVARDLLYAQQNNLARAIAFLHASNGGAGSGAAAAGAKPEEKADDAGAPASSAQIDDPTPSLHVLSASGALSGEQKRFFFAHGFVHLSRVVAAPLVQAALLQINEGLGDGINQSAYHMDKPENGRLKLCPKATGHPAIAALFRQSALPMLVESLMGPGQFTIPNGGQVALTFPNGHKHGATGPNGPAAAIANWRRPEVYSKHWHIDGIHKKSAGFENDEIKNFALLVGVYLSAAPNDFSGNIAVYPGSHRALEAYFRQEDPLMRLVDDQLPRIHLNPPHQLHVRPGDVLLAHYSTAHTVSPNLSPDVRYAVYFRISHTSRQGNAYSPECFTNLWTEFAGMRDLHLEEQQAQAQVEAVRQAALAAQHAAEAERLRQIHLAAQHAEAERVRLGQMHLQAAQSQALTAKQRQEEADRQQAEELQRLWNQPEQPPPHAQQPRQSHLAAPYALPVHPPPQHHQQYATPYQAAPYALPYHHGGVAAGAPVFGATPYHPPPAHAQPPPQPYSAYPGLQPQQQPHYPSALPPQQQPGTYSQTPR